MVKTLMRSVREYKKSSILTPVFVTFEVILEVIIPLLMAKLIDYGIEAGNMQYILKMGAILVICCIVSLTFGALSGKYAAVASAGFAKNLRMDMYNKVQEYSFSNIDKFSAASIVTRLTTDITNIQNAYQMAIRVAVRSPIMLIFALLLISNISNVSGFRVDLFMYNFCFALNLFIFDLYSISTFPSTSFISFSFAFLYPSKKDVRNKLLLDIYG